MRTLLIIIYFLGVGSISSIVIDLINTDQVKMSCLDSNLTAIWTVDNKKIFIREFKMQVNNHSLISCTTIDKKLKANYTFRLLSIPTTTLTRTTFISTFVTTVNTIVTTVNTFNNITSINRLSNSKDLLTTESTSVQIMTSSNLIDLTTSVQTNIFTLSNSNNLSTTKSTSVQTIIITSSNSIDLSTSVQTNIFTLSNSNNLSTTKSTSVQTIIMSSSKVRKIDLSSNKPTSNQESKPFLKSYVIKSAILDEAAAEAKPELNKYTELSAIIYLYLKFTSITIAVHLFALLAAQVVTTYKSIISQSAQKDKKQLQNALFIERLHNQSIYFNLSKINLK